MFLRLVGIFACATALAGCVSQSPESQLASDGTPRLTDQQLLDGLNLRENQVRSIFTGDGTRSIDTIENGKALSFGSSGGGVIQDGDPINPFMEAAIQRDEQDPLVFLPALNSRDPEVVLTAMWLLSQRGLHQPGHGRLPKNANIDQKHAIAEAIRGTCFNSTDVRIRWLAFHFLWENDLGDDSDAARALADNDDSVRQVGFLLFEKSGRRVDEQFNSKDPAVLQAARTTKGKLVALVLDHIGDDDWVIRTDMLRELEFVCVGTKWNQCNMPPHAPPFTSIGVSVIADRQSVLNTQAAWKNWWAANGQMILDNSTGNPKSN